MSDDILTLPPPSADARIAYGPEGDQFGELWLPEGNEPHPVAILLHGGYWRARVGLGYLGHAGMALRGQGVAVWNVEYRRLGSAGGGWPGTFLDVARGVDFLRTLAQEYPLDLKRVIAAGHSAGGHLAAWVAARRRIDHESPLATGDALSVAGVVSLAGVLDLKLAWDLALSELVVRELLGGGPDAYPERYAAASPAALLPFGLPQVLFHGNRDAHVPYEVSLRYEQLARVAGDAVELITLPGAGHFELVDPRTAEWRRVEAGILRLLGEHSGE